MELRGVHTKYALVDEASTQIQEVKDEPVNKCYREQEADA